MARTGLELSGGAAGSMSMLPMYLDSQRSDKWICTFGDSWVMFLAGTFLFCSFLERTFEAKPTACKQSTGKFR